MFFQVKKWELFFILRIVIPGYESNGTFYYHYKIQPDIRPLATISHEMFNQYIQQLLTFLASFPLNPSIHAERATKSQGEQFPIVEPSKIRWCGLLYTYCHQMSVIVHYKIFSSIFQSGKGGKVADLYRQYWTRINQNNISCLFILFFARISLVLRHARFTNLKLLNCALYKFSVAQLIQRGWISVNWVKLDQHIIWNYNSTKMKIKIYSNCYHIVALSNSKSDDWWL